MTFTTAQQQKHRDTFVQECRQKAWGAACHADWISKGTEELMADYRKLEAEDRQLEADIKAAAGALDSHTVDNREKRKGMQRRRDQLAQNMQALAKASQEGHRAMQNLLQSVESNLALAKHAEEWKWKEAETQSQTPDGDKGTTD